MKKTNVELKQKEQEHSTLWGISEKQQPSIILTAKNFVKIEFKNKFMQFINKYSPREILKLLELLIKGFIKNIINSGNIFLKVALSPILLVLIILLGLILLLKKFLKDIFKILYNIFRFLRKLLFLSLQETIYYWEKDINISTKLLQDLTLGLNKMFHYIAYLFHKVSDDSVKYVAYNNKHNLTDRFYERNNVVLFLSVLRQFITWLLFILISVIMSLLLITFFFSGVSMLHQFLRSKMSQKHIDKLSNNTQTEKDIL